MGQKLFIAICSFVLGAAIFHKPAPQPSPAKPPQAEQKAAGPQVELCKQCGGDGVSQFGSMCPFCSGSGISVESLSKLRAQIK